MEFLMDSQTTLGLDDVLKLIKVQTAYGRAVKAELRPYQTEELFRLESDFDVLDLFVQRLKSDAHYFSKMRTIFMHIKDLQVTIDNIGDLVTLTQVELYEIKCLLIQMKELICQYGTFFQNLPEALKISFPSGSYELLDPTGEALETFYISDGYSKRLKSVRELLGECEKELKGARIKQIRALVGDYPELRFKPNGTTTINRSVEGLFEIMVADSRLYQVDEHYQHVTFAVVPDEAVQAKKQKHEILLQEEEEAMYEVRVDLTSSLSLEVDRFRSSLQAIGYLDFYLAKAFLAIGVNGVRPSFLKAGSEVTIVKGRHSLVESRLKRDKRMYTPVSVRFGTPVTLITGANMGGKTIALKMIGLIVGMAHMGLYVPAEKAEMPMFEFIASLIGDEQSIDLGLSTFGAEMMHLKLVLDQADREGLILIDELARGTNPTEGAALSESIIEALRKSRSKSVITTHFDGIGRHDDVKHLQVKGLKAIDKEVFKTGAKEIIEQLSLMMDYELEEVDQTINPPKDALTIAALLGLDKAIIDSARKYLHKDK
ncbi:MULTISPECIES: hypothetical protein [unclassified Fusibacter]|uniref:lysine 5,6-aminomutase reactivase ATPase KamC n=1 Tax=unclassified Fusibacter TaxID=2624464 RepID=UPI001011EEBD|nr:MULTISPECIES: hypothetical protein [unclassified Fusibacter]MCK8059307.1 hypothetical protein [Fusibacter sp. A2]NPE21229.1 hypothetical protein [Fusibacter sp. A1]RXV62497.1 hypothetical protein DWB64_05285 [Fusibacter sp. A1]